MLSNMNQETNKPNSGLIYAIDNKMKDIRTRYKLSK